MMHCQIHWVDYIVNVDIHSAISYYLYNNYTVSKVLTQPMCFDLKGKQCFFSVILRSNLLEYSSNKVASINSRTHVVKWKIIFATLAEKTHCSTMHPFYLRVCVLRQRVGCHSIRQRRPQKRGKSGRSRCLPRCRNPGWFPGKSSAGRYCPAPSPRRSRPPSSPTRTPAENWPRTPPLSSHSQGCTALMGGQVCWRWMM